MVLEAAAEHGARQRVILRVAQQLGVGAESLRQWVKQHEVDSGRRAGTTTADQRRIAELEREVRELRRANEILKSAAVFFGAELDGRRPR
jgi:transposase